MNRFSQQHPLRARLALALAALAAAAPPPGHAQRVQQPQTPFASLVGRVDMPVGRAGALSPDGRWAVFTADAGDGQTLWIMPTTGGEPRRLLESASGDMHPAFSPSGDRIYFFSTRVARGPTDDEPYPVAAPFDTQRGVISGDVRQIGLQPAVAPSPLVSPDGRWVAYVSRPAERLVLVPATGGRERILAPDMPLGIAMGLTWQADSRGLTTTRFLPGTTTVVRELFPIEGGERREIERGNHAGGRLLPDGRHRLLLAGGPDADRKIVILDERGDTVATAPYPDMDPGDISPDGRRLFARQTYEEAALHIVSTDGGGTRMVVPANGAYHWPVAMDRSGNIISESSDSLIVWDARGRRISTHVAPAGASWRHVVNDFATLFVPHGGGRVTGDLVLVHLPTDRRTTVSTLATRRNINGGGGKYGRDGDRFLFFERHEDGAHLKSVSAEGDVRLIRRIPFGWNPPMAANGQRLAWVEAIGDSTALMVSDGPDAAPRRIALLPVTAAGLSPTWSHDGRRILLTDDLSVFTIVTLPAAGGAATVRPITLPYEYWYETFWTPDDEAITMIAQPRDITATQVARVDVATGRATVLTADDPNPKWGHVLSEDGSMVAYPSDAQLGSTLWIYDLEAMIRDGRR